MNRIVVIGTSGSGKSTVARRLGEKLEFPVLELDSLYHQAGWSPLAGEEFRARVADFALQPSWVIDGNYTSEGIADLVWPVADTLVWLDLPRWVIMSRVIIRTLRRWATRQELWNGNREPLSGPFRLDPEKNIIRWAWTSYDTVRQRYEDATADPAAVHLRLYRLQTTDEVERFIKAVPR